MLSFVLTSVGAGILNTPLRHSVTPMMLTLYHSASQYIPFSSRRSHTYNGTIQDTDLSINLKPSASTSFTSSATAYSYSSDEASSSSTAYSSPSTSPTSSNATFPQTQGTHVATHDAPSSSTNSSSPPTEEELRKYAVIHQILRASDLYTVLDIDKKSDTNAMRRAYMKRCKACHPEYVVLTL